MNLKDYLKKTKKEQGLTLEKFAKKIGCSRVHINMILIGKAVPSYKMAALISQATEGQVSISEVTQYSEEILSQKK